MKPFQTRLYQVAIVGLQIVPILYFVVAWTHLINGFRLGGYEPMQQLVVMTLLGSLGLSVILWLSVIYQLWNSVPESIDGISPMQATIGFLVPVFNLFWIFWVVDRFARAGETYAKLEETSNLDDGDINRWLFGATIVFLLLPIPVIQWVLTWKMLGQAGNAANAMRGTRGEEMRLTHALVVTGAVTTALVGSALLYIAWYNTTVPDFPDIDEPCDCDVSVRFQVGHYHYSGDEESHQRATEAARTLKEIYEEKMRPSWNSPAILWLELNPYSFDPDAQSDNRVLEYREPSQDRIRDIIHHSFNLTQTGRFIVLRDGRHRYYLESDLNMREILDRLEVDEMEEYDGRVKHE